jgi:hypothetical protein
MAEIQLRPSRQLLTGCHRRGSQDMPLNSHQFSDSEYITCVHIHPLIAATRRPEPRLGGLQDENAEEN